jgi:AcrR family transcriptional regulator
MDFKQRTPTKSELTRRKILEAAYVLFLNQGFHATSMRQIAKKSDLALGGIYNHFNSKDDIFAAIIAEKHPYHQIVPLLASAEGDTVDEFLSNAARLLVEALGDNPDFLNIMLIEIVEFKAKHVPDLFEVLFPQILQIGMRLKKYDDQVRPIPIELMMRAFLGMFFSYYITQIMLAGLMPAGMQKDALNSFVDIFLNGIKTKQEILNQNLPINEMKLQG